MIFESLEVGPLGVNCYIVGCEETRMGIIVDPGGNVEQILKRVQHHGLTITMVLNTHGHFDHIGGNREACTACDARLLIHQGDADMLGRAAEVARKYGLCGENSPAADEWLVDGMTVNFGSCQLTVLHTPGHTQGGCCLYFDEEQKVITGDTLFADSIGRTDLPGGSHAQLLESIRNKLFTLPEEVVAYPGHGSHTTIGHEKKHNPYF